MHRVFPRVAPMRRTFASASSSSSYSFPRHKNATYWEILGVPEGASVQDVKVAYYKLVKTLHPDAHTQEDGHPIKIKDRFHALQTAYETLGNEKKRSSYMSSRNFARSPSADFSRHPRDPGYNPHSYGHFTTWEGRHDRPNNGPSSNPYNPYNPYYTPPPPRPGTHYYNPERDRYPPFFGFGQMNSKGAHQGRTQPPLNWKAVQKERVVGALFIWILFGLVLSQQTADNYNSQLRDSHNAAVRSLRAAEDQARHRGGDWRPAVEQRLARFKDRTAAQREADEAAGIFRTEEEMREIAKRERALEREAYARGDIDSAGVAMSGNRQVDLGEPGPLEQEMIRRREWEKRYPKGFVGPKEEWGQAFEAMRNGGKRKTGAVGEDKRPLTRKERREQLKEQGVREPRNPGGHLMGDGSARVGFVRAE